MPVLALVGGYMPAFGGNITMPSIIYLMKILAQNVQSIIVPNSGHWYQEEQPVVLLKLFNNFYSSNLTETSKKRNSTISSSSTISEFLAKVAGNPYHLWLFYLRGKDGKIQAII